MVKKYANLIALLFTLISTAWAPNDNYELNLQRIQHEHVYDFEACIEMEVDFFNRKGNHEQTIPYFSHFTDDFKHIAIRHERRNTNYISIFDMPNNNCIILLGEGDQLAGSAAVMKNNEGRTLLELPLQKSGETKNIAGFDCEKYLFDVKEFSGEMWITQDVDLPNDVGIFKASKTAKYYQKLTMEGFVMEITSITPKGARTVMRTIKIHDSMPYKIRIPADLGRSINQIDYYAY